jgi:hypothetical protein
MTLDFPSIIQTPIVMKLIYLIGLSFLFTGICTAQSYTAKVIDQKTGEAIPYASVITGKHSGVITNEEGVFSLTPQMVGRIQDSVYISSMGYEKKGVWLPAQNDKVISLVSKTFELGSVYIDGKGLEVDEIIERVKSNMAANYKMNLSKKQIFFRQSDFNLMDKLDFRFKKSTIPELNESLINSITDKIPRKSSYYREVAGEFYGDYGSHKLYIDKAAELYDKTKDVSVDGLTDKLEKIFQDNVKRNSYIKIRSGIFSTKMQLDSAQAAEGKESEVIKAETKDTNNHYFQQRVKDKISELYSEIFFNDGTELDFLEKSNRYRFELKDYTFIDENPVYIIQFSPKGKKDFEGVMYVNTDDYAIVRLEFENVRPLKKFGLLGITYRHSVYRGKMLFGKDASGTYSPRYIELEDGRQTGVDRPLNVIEKNKFVKGRRKQNELALHMDIMATTVQKYELVVFNTEDISKSLYENVKENPKVKATYLSRYDPDFWKGYTIMEPNAAIQAFKVFSD